MPFLRQKNTRKHDDVDDLPNSPSSRRGSGGSMSFEDTVNSGMASVPAVSFQEASDSADPALELEVLKCILLREGYLSRLESEARRGGRALVANKAAAAKLVDLLDLLRQITVETCEAIQRWRYTSKRPFMWNGVNYLLKVATDLDFVANLRPVVSWLGFNMERNPFVVPMSLDFRVPTPGPHAMRRAFEPSRDNFHTIGGGGGSSSIGRGTIPAAIAEVDESDTNTDTGRGDVPQSMAATARAYGNVGAAPGPGVSSSSAKSADDKRIEILRMMPSQVGDVDMLRIREAEKMILAEERTNGRFVRDENGKLVPEVIWQQMQALKAQQEMLAKRGGRPGLHTPLGSPQSSGGRLDGEQLVVYDTAGRDHQQATTGSAETTGIPGHGSSGHHVMEARQNTGPLRGRKQTLKDGGQLVPLSTSGTSGGERRPKARSHLAQLDADIKRQHRDNDRLMKKLERVRQELEKEESHHFRSTVRGVPPSVAAFILTFAFCFFVTPGSSHSRRRGGSHRDK